MNEAEWQKLTIELTKRMDAFLNDAAEGKDGLDGSICGYFHNDCAHRMATLAITGLRMSAEGQEAKEENE